MKVILPVQKDIHVLFDIILDTINSHNFSQTILVCLCVLNIVFLVREIIFEINYRDCALIASKNWARGPILICPIV